MAQRLEKVQNHQNLFKDLDSGIYYVRAMIRRKVKWRSTRCTTEKAAISEARKILGALESSRGDEKRTPTVEEFWNLYREAKAKQKSPLTWLKEDRLFKKHFLPQFGRFAMDEVTGLQIERFLNWRRHKVSEGTAANEGAILHAFFGVAVAEDVIDKNPMRRFKAQSFKTRERVLSLEEQDKLEAEGDAEFKRWLRFRLATGVRCAELAGIVAERDIDWVRQEVQVIGKGHRGVKKVRKVPFVPEHFEEIKRIVEEQRAYIKAHPHGFKNGRDKLFPQLPDSWAQKLDRVARAAGVPHITPHALRHTFATRYLKGGGDIYILSKILGHASVSVTEKVYAHLLTEDLVARSAGIRLLD